MQPLPDPKPKPPGRRKVFAVLALVAGLAMLALEVVRPPRGTTGFEGWFWRVVGVSLILLAVAELASRPPKDL